MLNHIVLMGRLTRDPEFRRTPAGVAVATFSIAVDRDFSSGSGEKETDFIDIVTWRNTAEFVSRSFSKGRMIVVSGRLQIRTWNDKEGNKRRSSEVIADSVYFGDSKRDDQSTGSNPYPTYGTDYSQPTTAPQQPVSGYQQQQFSDYSVIEEEDGQLPY